MSKDLSPSGNALGLSMYRAAAVANAKAKKKARAARAEASAGGGDALTSGTLNGTDWSHEESRSELYKFAKAEGLPVKSRDGKPAIIKALSDATKAQG